MAVGGLFPAGIDLSQGGYPLQGILCFVAVVHVVLSLPSDQVQELAAAGGGTSTCCSRFAGSAEGSLVSVAVFRRRSTLSIDVVEPGLSLFSSPGATVNVE